MFNRHAPSPWLGILKFMWIAIFTVSLYALAVTMVHHHFTSGGLDHHNWRDSR